MGLLWDWDVVLWGRGVWVALEVEVLPGSFPEMNWGVWCLWCVMVGLQVVNGVFVWSGLSPGMGLLVEVLFEPESWSCGCSDWRVMSGRSVRRVWRECVESGREW